jgi:hypothetical protein
MHSWVSGRSSWFDGNSVIQKIIREDEDVKVPLALDLFGISADNGFRRFV